MSWWREVLIGLAAVGVTVAVIGIVRKKAHALGWATAAIICSKFSTPIATWFGKKWLWPILDSFREGYKARLNEEPEPGGKKGLSGYEIAKRKRERRLGG